jgi:hypothetical protein
MEANKQPKVVVAISPERRDRDGKVVRKEGEGWWCEVGTAWVNADDSINIYLDAIPVSGRLQIREKRDRRERSMEEVAR